MSDRGRRRGEHRCKVKKVWEEAEQRVSRRTGRAEERDEPDEEAGGTTAAERICDTQEETGTLSQTPGKSVTRFTRRSERGTRGRGPLRAATPVFPNSEGAPCQVKAKAHDNTSDGNHLDMATLETVCEESRRGARLSASESGRERSRGRAKRN